MSLVKSRIGTPTFGAGIDYIDSAMIQPASFFLRGNMYKYRLLFSLLFLLSSFGCASTGTGDSSGRRMDPDVITRAELEGIAQANQTVYEAIGRLRVTWLRPRTPASIQFNSDRLPKAMIDNQQFELDTLHQLRIENVQELRFVDAREATFRWGTGFANGVIEVVTRRSGS